MGKVARLADYRPKNSADDFDDWQKDWRMELEADERSPHTIRAYLQDINGFIKWFEQTQGPFSPELITNLDLRDYKRFLAQTAKPATINRKICSMSAFLTWAQDTERIKSVPKMPRMVKEQRQGIRWLSPDQQHDLLQRVERDGSCRDLGMVKLLLNTGLRVAELTDLRWGDVEISDRCCELVVRAGKGSKRRVIPLNKDARSALLLLGYEKNRGMDKSVMQGQRGGMVPRGVCWLLKKYRGNLSNFSVHTLRHTFCKNLVDAGVSLEKIAALAGHENLETTRRYCQPSPNDLAKAVDLIGQED
ncbi:tyrosine-type recombinase/integrase [Microcoleus sp. FACHB-53]|nr:tyrosine-type recombinase/integrase [Microcoleus sp. FACHB-53]